MGGVSDLNINKCNQSTLFSRMIDFWKKKLLNGTYLMRPWSVEDNLLFLRNGTDFSARHLSSMHSNFFLNFRWANEVQQFISL